MDSAQPVFGYPLLTLACERLLQRQPFFPSTVLERRTLFARAPAAAPAVLTIHNLVDPRCFAALSPRYNVDPGAVRSRSDFEIAAKLAASRSDATNTNPGAERRLLLLTFRAATIVSDYHVQPTGDPSQIDRHM